MSNDKDSKPESSFRDWLSTIGVILGLFVALTSFILNIQEWTHNPKAFRSVSLAGFVLYLLSTIWFAFRALNANKSWRWMSLVLLYVVTVPYFTWAGTWLPVRQGIATDQALVPITHHFYDFEGIDRIPANIELKGHAMSTTLTSEESLPSGQHSLKLELELPSWKGEEDTGGIYVDMGDIEYVDAVSVYVLVPDQDDTRTGGFSLYFVATDEQGHPVWSGSQSIPVGKWTPQFWGTRYAHSDGVLCPDEDRDSQCDKSAEGYWREWTSMGISGFYIRIIRDDGYQGPVYIDNITAYCVAQ